MVLLAFSQGHLQVELPVATQEFKGNGVAGILVVYERLDLVGPLHRVIVNGEDHVAAAQTAQFGRTAGQGSVDVHAARTLEFQGFFLDEFLTYFQHFHTQVTAHHPAVGENIINGLARQVDRHSQAVTDVKSRARGDSSINTDHLAAQVEQRPSRVAGVDHGIGLNKTLDAVGSFNDRGLAVQGANDAIGQRCAQAQGMADGQDQIANF